jgi:EAL domain-containing protein (putative c-di-GMP-specific phosphodiesterase class I)
MEEHTDNTPTKGLINQITAQLAWLPEKDLLLMLTMVNQLHQQQRKKKKGRLAVAEASASTMWQSHLVSELSYAELLARLLEITANIRQQALARGITEAEDIEMEATKEKAKRSILDLHGLGKEIWNNIDAQQYVHEMRQEWDYRA